MLFVLGALDFSLGQSLADQSLDTFRCNPGIHDRVTRDGGTVSCDDLIRHGADSLCLNRRQPQREHVGKPVCARNIAVRFPVQPNRVVDRGDPIRGRGLGMQADRERLAGLFYLTLTERTENT